jgi:hypothetical protein
VSREITKTQAELVKLGQQVDSLQREMTARADRLRALRLAAIRAGSDPSELPFVPRPRPGLARDAAAEGADRHRESREGRRPAQRPADPEPARVT